MLRSVKTWFRFASIKLCRVTMPATQLNASVTTKWRKPMDRNKSYAWRRLKVSFTVKAEQSTYGLRSTSKRSLPRKVQGGRRVHTNRRKANSDGGINLEEDDEDQKFQEK